MKKIYSAPVAEIYMIKTQQMLAQSVEVNKDEEVNASESLSNKYESKSFLWEDDTEE